MRPVHLPAGTWYDIRTGEAVEGPTTVIAEAEPGDIAVYAPAGAVVPRLPEGVETLVETEDPEVVDHTDVADRMDLDVFLGAEGRFELADGTVIELTGEVGDDRTVTVDGDELEATETDRGVQVTTAEADEVELRVGGATLIITGAPQARAYTIDLVG